MRHYIIYEYIFPNGKRYIGKTCRTMNERQGSEMERYRRCTLLYNAIKKYGIDSIKTIILYEGEMTTARSSEIERFYIAFFKTNANRYKSPSYGYNLTDGGEGVAGWKPDEKRLKVLQEQMRAQGLANRGRVCSEETRHKLSEAHKGKSHLVSDETKRRIGKSNSLENMSPEERLRRSNSKKRKVYMLDTFLGSVTEFESRTAAAEKFGVASSMVSRWLTGERVCASGRYKFYNYPPTSTERERLCTDIVCNSQDTSDTAITKLVREGQW